MKSIAILTTKNQWFQEHAEKLSKELKCSLYFNHNKTKNFDIVFILSYHNIIPRHILKSNRHNIVIHASALPKGKGWAPFFWQVIEGKKEIVFSMFEANSGVDDGPIYMQKRLHLTGYELYDELREKQANLTSQMCKEFIENYEKYKTPTPQKGEESFYPKRTPKESKLNIDKTIKEQFNLLRVVNNDEFPAFFELDGHRYTLKIESEKWGGRIELIDFVDLTRQEKEFVLSMRNHESIRKWMYNSEPIALREHLDFIGSLELNTQMHYLLIKKDHTILGVVDFKFNNKEAFFGLYTNSFEKMAGAGRVLEEVCIKYIFEILNLNRLKLEVFKDNKPAIHLYRKYNFKEVNNKIINKKEIICMELEFKGQVFTFN